MKKSIVIIGPPRSGKSTLAQKIVKEINGFSMISGDNFSTSYFKTCDFFNISTLNVSIPKIQGYYYLTESMHYENSINYVFETTEYNEKIIEKYRDKLIVIFLGYPKLTEKELFDNIRKNDKETDWTYEESDFRLSFYCTSFVEECKVKKQIAEKHQYWYIDTSYDREKVLKETIEILKNDLDKN